MTVHSIQYNQKDFIIQTPHCFIPFGLKKYSTTSTKTYLDITFQGKHDELIQDCFSVFYQRVIDKYANHYQIEPFVKESQSSKWMRFKVSEDCLFFDQKKDPIDSFNPKVLMISQIIYYCLNLKKIALKEILKRK